MTAPQQRPPALRIVSTAEEDEAVALDALFEAGVSLVTLLVVFVVCFALGMAAVRWWPGAS